MSRKRRKSGAQWVDPTDLPQRRPTLAQQLAHVIQAHAVADPDLVMRRWFTALCNNMIAWPEPRRSPISTAAFQDSLQYVAESGGIYYEGLVLRDADRGRPQPAIWVSTPTELVCFTHDLSMPHALVGIPISDSSLSALFHFQGVSGPYLFSKTPGVLENAVPFNRGFFGDTYPTNVQ